MGETARTRLTTKNNVYITPRSHGHITFSFYKTNEETKLINADNYSAENQYHCSVNNDGIRVQFNYKWYAMCYIAQGGLWTLKPKCDISSTTILCWLLCCFYIIRFRSLQPLFNTCSLSSKLQEHWLKSTGTEDPGKKS